MSIKPESLAHGVLLQITDSYVLFSVHGLLGNCERGQHTGCQPGGHGGGPRACSPSPRPDISSSCSFFAPGPPVLTSRDSPTAACLGHNPHLSCGSLGQTVLRWGGLPRVASNFLLWLSRTRVPAHACGPQGKAFRPVSKRTTKFCNSV